MKDSRAGALPAFLACCLSYAGADQPTFEVASVRRDAPTVGRPAGRVGCFGGPGSADPIRFTCAHASVSLMVLDAYGLRPYQLQPSVSQDNLRFTVEAKVPLGATAEQVRPMLQNLLDERFKLAFHREKREVPGYALVVAKGGLKMKRSAPNPPAVPSTAPITDADGFTYFPARNYMAVSRANGLTRWVGMNIPVDAGARDVRLTGLLNSLTGQPVIDSTGLAGKYDFTLTFASDPATLLPPGGDGQLVPPDGGLPLFSALEAQLGLRLEPRRIAVDMFVIDHVEKTPVGN